MRDPRLSRVGDLLSLEGLSGQIVSIIVYDQDKFRAIGRAGDTGDRELTGQQGLILIATEDVEIELSGSSWGSSGK